jgi:CRP-like cAMP-binding protein
MNDTHNYILKKLPADEFEEFVSCSTIKRLDLKDTLIEPGVPIEFVDFVESGMYSIVALGEVEAVEVATVGREGMVGIPILLGASSTICRCFCQVSGHSRRLTTPAFKRLLVTCPTFALLCGRYSFSLFEQAAQNSACNRLHTIEERCAKWLLLSHDRVDGSEFDLTQEFLAQMLGVRRQSVNLAAGVLQAAGIIKYSRGIINILKRKELEEVSCECYKLIRRSLELQES